MCFVVYNRPQLRKDHPEKSPKDILKIAGQKWNTLTDAEKQIWGNEACHANSNRVNINDNMKTLWEGGVRSTQMFKPQSGKKSFAVEKQFDKAQTSCVNLANSDNPLPSGSTVEIEDEPMLENAEGGTAFLNKMNEKIKKETGADIHEDDEKKINPVCMPHVDEVIDLTVGLKSSLINRFDKQKEIMKQA